MGALLAALHEVAHLMTKEWDHPPAFWDNFCVIMREARRLDLYDPSLLRRNAVYRNCGTAVDSSYEPCRL